MTLAFPSVIHVCVGLCMCFHVLSSVYACGCACARIITCVCMYAYKSNLEHAHLFISVCVSVHLQSVVTWRKGFG